MSSLDACFHLSPDMQACGERHKDARRSIQRQYRLNGILWGEGRKLP